MKRQRQKKGFTLIELMIVVVIVGILAAMAVPRFMPMTIKSKQTEAKAILKQMFAMERTYRQANNSYWGQGLSADSLPANQRNFATIGVEVPEGAKYQFRITVASGGNLVMTATATGLDDDLAPDIWQMDQDGVLTCTSDDVVL